MFNLSSVLIALRHYHLQIEKLDQIITVVKNWPNDPCLNCLANANFKDYIKVKLINKFMN
jgi:hypothetical protein